MAANPKRKKLGRYEKRKWSLVPLRLGRDTAVFL